MIPHPFHEEHDVTVVEDDLLFAFYGKAFECLVARAMIRTFPDYKVRVCHSIVEFYPRGGPMEAAAKYTMDEVGCQLVRDFDAHRPLTLPATIHLKRFEYRG